MHNFFNELLLSPHSLSTLCSKNLVKTHVLYNTYALVEIFLRISQKLSSIFSFFNFLRNSGRFFRFLQKVLDYLRKLQNEKFNIQRKAEKLQISDKF